MDRLVNHWLLDDLKVFRKAAVNKARLVVKEETRFVFSEVNHNLINQKAFAIDKDLVEKVEISWCIRLRDSVEAICIGASYVLVANTKEHVRPLHTSGEVDSSDKSHEDKDSDKPSRLTFTAVPSIEAAQTMKT